ncbi:unnamed protein product, partial [Rotaria magnacalcarata]
HNKSCIQCPSCKTYVPIPLGLRSSQTPVLVDSRSVDAPLAATTSIQGYPLNVARVSQIAPIPMRAWSPAINALSDYERSWRSKFWRTPVLIHGIIELVLTVLIIILEIISLGLTTYRATGAGMWGSIPFMTAAILTIRQVTRWDRSRVWATRVLIAQMVLLLFTFILIGIVNNFVSSNSFLVSSAYIGYYELDSNSVAKYRVMQAQLAFIILLMFAGFAYVGFYLFVTYVALWKPFGTLDTPHLFSE